jgi:hypothetical protein
MKSMITLAKEIRACQLVGVTLSMLIGAAASPAQIQSAESCASSLRTADIQYRAGYFDKALALIKPCLGQQKLSKKEMAEAYKLLGMIGVGKDNLQEAKISFLVMLALDSEMTLDETREKPEVIEVFKQVRNGLFEAPKKNEKDKWVWISVGMFLTGFIAGAILAGN